MPIFLKFGDVLGDVEESGHRNWIALSAVSWGVARAATEFTGGGREVAAPRVGELTLAKDEDVASIPLIQESLAGEGRDAQIDFVRTGQDPMEIYYSIVLSGALVTAFSQSSAGERPVETVTLNFTKVTFTGTQMDRDAAGTSPVSYGWDVSANMPA